MNLRQMIRMMSLASYGAVLAGSAFAGPIILENNAAANVCKVEVTIGAEAPKGPVQKFGDLEFNWRQNFDTNRLCYRVSNPPVTCNGSWTDWRCCDSTGGESLCAIN